MENKTAMTHLIEKILRMPESNIKGFLNISGPAYIEAEKEQIIDAWEEGCYQSSRFPRMSDVEQYYNETYGSQAPQRLEEANGK